MQRIFWIAVIVIAVYAVRDFSRRDIAHPPGILAPSLPVQADLPPADPVPFGDFEIQRRAAFTVEARVLSTRRYRFGRAADLSPLDLALGWGPMSDQAVLDRLDIAQSSRWYSWSYQPPAPLPNPVVSRHSANMHMVPAEAGIEDELLALRTGDVVRLDGFLIDAGDDSGFTWKTSLTREDTGNGACELFLVTGLSRAPRP